MTKRILFLLLTFTILVNTLYSSTYIVPEDYPSIQAAVDAAVTGDSIFVQKGVYRENILIEGKGLYISSFFTTPDLDNMRETIIDGEKNESVIYVLDCPDTVTIRGFTLCNGLSQYGGGLRCGYSALKVEDVVIRDNATFMTDPYCGGGFAAGGDCYVIMKNVMISGNKSYAHGGGIVIRTNSVLIGENLTVSHNVCSSDGHGKGGGIYVDLGSSMTLYRSTIKNNIASKWGGGIGVADDTFVSLVNVTVNGNLAGIGGGAIYCCYDNSRIFLGNCILFNNLADIFFANDQEIWIDDTGSNNQLAFCFSDIEGGRSNMYVPGHSQAIDLEGNIDEIPYFNPDLTLATPSSCIDAGTDYYSYWGEELINIPPDQFYGTMPDMGAFENWDIILQLPELPGSQDPWIKLYPNPASKILNIEVNYPVSKDFDVFLTDMRGFSVLRKIISTDGSGKNTFTIVLGDISPGPYILCIRSGTEIFAEEVIIWRPA